MASPKIRIVRQGIGKPHATMEARYSIDDFEPEDATVLRAGTKAAYTIYIVAAEALAAILDSSCNHIGPPGCEGLYDTPWHIGDEALGYYAADIWTAACGIGLGGLVWMPETDREFEVTAFEQRDVGYGSEGYATGFLLVTSVQQPDRKPLRVRIDSVEKRARE
ncbi:MULTISPECIES: hypothetical protein [Streptomyces]|uniref:Uncharacterized protein n=1 Tax=Streptomyces mordarskii TaxID=1226758 RepID=A0ABP3LRB6_9ACTN